MKVTKVKPVTKTEWMRYAKKYETPEKLVKRLENFTYKSDIDPAVIIHSNKTHRSASEAFRDAEYACAITKFKSDWQLSLEFLGGVMYGFWMVGMALLIPILLVLWLTK